MAKINPILILIIVLIVVVVLAYFYTQRSNCKTKKCAEGKSPNSHVGSANHEDLVHNASSPKVDCPRDASSPKSNPVKITTPTAKDCPSDASSQSEDSVSEASSHHGDHLPDASSHRGDGNVLGRTHQDASREVSSQKGKGDCSTLVILPPEACPPDAILLPQDCSTVVVSPLEDSVPVVISPAAAHSPEVILPAPEERLRTKSSSTSDSSSSSDSASSSGDSQDGDAPLFFENEPSPLSEIRPFFHRIEANDVVPAAAPVNPKALSNTGAWSFNNVAAAYGLGKVAGVQSGVLAGKGAVVAIVNAYSIPTIVSDLTASLSSSNGIAAGSAATANKIAANLKIVKIGSSGQVVPSVPTSQGWGIEHSLDVQTIMSLCPGAQVYLVQANSPTANDLTVAIQYAVLTLQAQVVSMSWGGSYPCANAQFVNGDPMTCLSDSIFQTYPNTIFVAAAGDYGAQTGWPMAHPNVVAAGGTTLLSVDVAAGTCVQTAWKGSGGGPDGYYPAHPAQQVAYNKPIKALTPDVAFVADPTSGVWIYNTSVPAGTPAWAVYGGTSLSAPIFASIVALINSARVSRSKAPLTQKQVFSAIYGPAFKGPGVAHAAPQSNYFLPITVGNNNNALSGYSASVGYDYVTGQGSTNNAFYSAMVAL
jgi:hypothetical protein